jgi:putative alpha-1,2-mannosidase
VIELRVGISAVDEEGAKKNLLHETDGLGFEKLSTNAKNFWQIELSKIQV